MSRSKCPKCDSTERIPGVRVLDQDHGNRVDLGATVQAYPAGFLFNGTVKHKFHARVCGNCGYTEFYVDEPKKLLALARGEQPE